MKQSKLLQQTGQFLLLVCLCGVPAFRAHAAPQTKSLDIYFIDVEGGQSTLFVTPGGESLLIDTGWSDNNNRDADRIAAAAKRAGVSKIDYVLLTHYHTDHAGGVSQLVAKIPVGTFIDHGPNRETAGETQKNFDEYLKVVSATNAKRIIAKPGDALPLQSMHVEVVSGDGNAIDNPLPGAGQPNPACASSAKFAVDPSENARSLGVLITYGKARILDLGDLSSAKELNLVCPNNKLGQVDLLVVSHHGSDFSNSPALLTAIAPRVAVMDNGAKKGGSPSSWDAVHGSPRIQDLWQLHFADAGGKAHNSSDELIANPDGPDAANYIKVSVSPDGSMDVFNSRTTKTKHYAASAPR